MPVNTTADPTEHVFRLVRWIRLYLSGRSVVDPQQLKCESKRLTEQQWLLAVRETISKRRGNDNSKQPDPDSIPDGHPSALEALYRQEILSILKRNLMEEDLPYLDAILLETPVKSVAADLGAKRSTAWKRMQRVRRKAQEIITSLQRGNSA